MKMNIQDNTTTSSTENSTMVTQSHEESSHKETITLIYLGKYFESTIAVIMCTPCLRYITRLF